MTMGFSSSDFAAALKAGASISAEDVLAVRRWVWPDGSVSAEEAEALFALNRAAKASAPEWADFFIEAMTDYVVNQTPPRGYVEDGHAAWLIGQIEQDGAPITPTELALVVKVLEAALNAPASLKAWALGQIEQSVLADGRVGEQEAASLRRIVFAAAGGGALTVSADEAELLWRIKDACVQADNAPGWKTLFVQAVGNHLMAYSSYTPLERSEAARLDAFVADHHRSVLGFFARMGSTNPSEVRAALAQKSHGDHDAAVAAAGAVTPAEDQWLQTHIDADGARDPYEEALLAFVAEN
ncbi:MAG TPA: hypothetical protein VK614_06460 [Allosphingosinicella sp.]|nr:hypothetical protein [Allosphingosinicella sp.]